MPLILKRDVPGCSQKVKWKDLKRKPIISKLHVSRALKVVVGWVPSPPFTNKQSVRSLFIWKKVHITPEGYSSKQGKETSPCSQACWALPFLSLLSLLQPHEYCLEMVLAIPGGRRRSRAMSHNPPVPLQQWKCKGPAQSCTPSSPFRDAPQVPLGSEVSAPCLNLCFCTVFWPASWWGVARGCLSCQQRGMFLCWEQQPRQGTADLHFLLVSVETLEKALSHALCCVLNGNNVAFLFPKECFEDTVTNMYE